MTRCLPNSGFPSYCGPCDAVVCAVPSWHYERCFVLNPFADGWLFLLNTPRSLQHFCSFTHFATRPPPRDRETRASHPPDLAAPPHKLDDIHDCRTFLGPPWSWRGRGTDGPRVGLLGGQTHDGPLPLSMSGDVRFSIQVAVSARSSVIRNFATDLSCTIGQQTYGGGTR